MKIIVISDKHGDKHRTSLGPLDDMGRFKLVCTNSGDELVRGEEIVRSTRRKAHRFINISSHDPIFCDHGVLELQIEDQVNEVMA
jgi:hypothetical protein